MLNNNLVNTQPLISVVIPTYDRQELLLKALKSVVCQTYTNIEVIIVDDASKHAIDLSEFNDENVLYYKNSARVGGAASRNIGVSLSSGEYVCFLDDDDLYLESKLYVLYEHLCYLEKKELHVDVVFGVVKRTDDKKLKYERLCNKRIKSLYSLSFLHTNGSLIKREVLTEIYFNERLSKYQDTQLHCELILKKNAYFLNTPVAIWNVSHNLPQITDMPDHRAKLRDYYSYLSMYEYLLESCKLKAHHRWYFRLGIWIRFNRLSNSSRNKLNARLSKTDSVICWILRFLIKDKAKV